MDKAKQIKQSPLQPQKTEPPPKVQETTPLAKKQEEKAAQPIKQNVTQPTTVVKPMIMSKKPEAQPAVAAPPILITLP